MTCTLFVTRAKDRAAMAQAAVDAFTAAGAVSVERKLVSYAPRRVTLAVTAPGGATLNFQIDGDFETIGGTWNTPQGVFLSPLLGDVNPHHYGKLNRIFYADEFDGAVRLIVRDLHRFADGMGYLMETDPQIVAMRERYAQNAQLN